MGRPDGRELGGDPQFFEPHLGGLAYGRRTPDGVGPAAVTGLLQLVGEGPPGKPLGHRDEGGVRPGVVGRQRELDIADDLAVLAPTNGEPHRLRRVVRGIDLGEQVGLGHRRRLAQRRDAGRPTPFLPGGCEHGLLHHQPGERTEVGAVVEVVRQGDLKGGAGDDDRPTPGGGGAEQVERRDHRVGADARGHSRPVRHGDLGRVELPVERSERPRDRRGAGPRDRDHDPRRPPPRPDRRPGRGPVGQPASALRARLGSHRSRAGFRDESRRNAGMRMVRRSWVGPRGVWTRPFPSILRATACA